MKRFEKYIKDIHQDFPDFVISSIKKIGEGDNSKAFLINEDYIFRFSKREEVKEQVRREIAVLPKIKPLVTIQIPGFTFISPSMNYVGYRMIKGENLSGKIFKNLTQKDQQNVQKTLADFLSAIHAIDLLQLKNGNLETMDLKEEYHENFEKAKRLIFPHLSQNKREIITRFFIDYLDNEDNFNYAECLIHNDFSTDHILFNTINKQITGIIDFGDIAIGDPDYDLM
ncbi:MAG TPA: aminoglycoside phosphotransferase family protein, partial [Hanamia sp.]